MTAKIPKDVQEALNRIRKCVYIQTHLVTRIQDYISQVIEEKEKPMNKNIEQLKEAYKAGFRLGAREEDAWVPQDADSPYIEKKAGEYALAVYDNN